MSNIPLPSNRIIVTSIRMLVVAVALLNLLVFGLTGMAIYSGYEQQLEKARTDAQNLAQVLQQNINGSIEKIDAVLFSSKLEIERQLASGSINKLGLNSYLARQHQNILLADSLRATNSEGDTLYGTGVPAGEPRSMAARKYFLFLRDTPSAVLAISDPVIGAISGKRVIVFARRINKPSGAFAGVVYAPVTTDVFSHLFSSLNLGPKGSVSLRKGFDDFSIIVRHPENIPDTNISAAGNLRHSPTFTALVERGDSNHVYEAVTGVDRIYRTFSVRRLDKYNYYVGVGLAHEDILANWRSETIKLLSIACVFLVMSIMLAQRHRQALQRQKEAFGLLESMALLDGLTGIPNRRFFDEKLQEKWLLARREQRPISLIMIDIDHFKSYNDYHGHSQGDVCLAMVAKTLNESVKRPSDLVARYGGEEFVMLLPNTQKHGAYRVAERARQLIESLHIQHGFSDASSWITISAGIYTTTPTNEDVASALIENADRLLYQAKHDGRNRVCESQ